MGFDIYGLKPKTNKEEHSYFRANVWYWRPLWSFVEKICSEEIEKLEEDIGQYNDGCEVSDNIATDIGNKLIIALEGGSFKKFQDDFEKKEDCNDDNKKAENINTWYKCDYELTKSFANFCLNSGGFSIC
tara:strand:+ start:93 stop:482 length:390 start_codon:yes stop_codon:yes gene_type:complete